MNVEETKSINDKEICNTAVDFETSDPNINKVKVLDASYRSLSHATYKLIVEIACMVSVGVYCTIPKYLFKHACNTVCYGTCYLIVCILYSYMKALPHHLRQDMGV